MAYDDSNNVVNTVKYTPSRHWEEETYVCIFPRLTGARLVKKELRVQNPDFAKWSDREMTLMMTGSDDFCHNPIEIHDDYKFKTDTTLTMQLIVHFSSSEDRNDSNNNNNTDNNNQSPTGLPDMDLFRESYS